MKKNGFTLIELLAVIVILAIIALIAAPIILNIIRDARESANERSRELYETAVKTAIMKKKIEDTKAEIKGSFIQTNAGRTLTSASGDVVLTVEYDGDVQCDVIEVLENYELKLDGCKVEGVDSNYNGTVTSPSTPSQPGGSNNPTGGQEPEDDGSNPQGSTQFERDSWATIVSNVRNENIDMYKVGDTKKITLYGSPRTVRIANKTNTGDVCTEEYYSIVNEDGTKTQTEEKYSKTACGFVIEFAEIIDGFYNSDNEGGWPESIVRSYIENSLYNDLPSHLKNAIIETTVVSGHSPDDAPNKVSTDKLYLLSTAEIIQGGISKWDTATHLTRQLDYYEGLTKDDYSKANKNSAWWLRTADAAQSDSYLCMESDGSFWTCVKGYNVGISPAFRIG